MEMIRLEHVTKSFGEHTVLDDFSISIPEGEFLTVIGRSGCGKTTMLKMIKFILVEKILAKRTSLSFGERLAM